MGPLCFALTLHPVVEQIKREVPVLFINAWYFHDRTLCGPPRDIYSALTIIESQGPSRCLLLNKNKCYKSLLFVPADATLPDHVLPPGIPTTNGGFKLLGSPVGPPTFYESCVYRRSARSRICWSSCRIYMIHRWKIPSYVLVSVFRNLQTSSKPALSAFDNTMREALSDLAGGPLSDRSWLKASLPSSLNLRRGNASRSCCLCGFPTSVKCFNC